MENLPFPGRQLHSLSAQGLLIVKQHCNQLIKVVFLNLLPFSYLNGLVVCNIFPDSFQFLCEFFKNCEEGGKWGQRVVQRKRVQKWQPIISPFPTSDYIIPLRVFIRNGGWESLLGGQDDDHLAVGGHRWMTSTFLGLKSLTNRVLNARLHD